MSDAGLTSGGPATAGYQAGTAVRPWLGHVALLTAYVVAGVAVTWPLATYLPDGLLPANQDDSSYVWYLWWTVHQLVHAGNPFFTRYMAAPVGTDLGFTTTMPLAGWLMAPVTLTLGPSASFDLLVIIIPGLLCYAAFRAARLWLNWPAAMVSGAFYGLSSMLASQDWYHVNIALGSVFLPLAVEAAVLLRRAPSKARAAWLGLVLGVSVLANQESSVVAVVLAGTILVPWLSVLGVRDRVALRSALAPVGLAVAVALVFASPELAAMGQQAAAGGASVPLGVIAPRYAKFGVPLPTLFAPSPRLGQLGLGNLASAYSFDQPFQAYESVATFGAVLTALAVVGLVIGRRKRVTWAFAGLWLVGAVLALGTSLVTGSGCQLSTWRAPGTWWGRACRQYVPLPSHLGVTQVLLPTGQHAFKPVTVSSLMPFTWMIHIPGLGALREADRFAIAGLLGAALLAGLAVQWLTQRRAAAPLIAVVVGLGALEAGWSANGQVMPANMPAVDRLIASDHSGSIVLDIPFGLSGGIGMIGSRITPTSLVMATSDGHPRAISYTSWVPGPTSARIAAHAFYQELMRVESGSYVSAAQVRRARANLRGLHVGWVVEWRDILPTKEPPAWYSHVDAYLIAVGFRQVQPARLVNVPAGRDCPVAPTDQRVVLYHYQ